MEITLIPVNDDNREAVIALYVREDQRPFIATNEASLEAAARAPGMARPFAVCDGDRAVGFAMFAFDEDWEDPDDRHWLWRFMTDRNEQGKGYGTAALGKIIEYFRDHGADAMTLSTKPENEAALRLYRRFGFAETGEMNDGETVLRLYLRTKGPENRK